MHEVYELFNDTSDKRFVKLTSLETENWVFILPLNHEAATFFNSERCGGSRAYWDVCQEYLYNEWYYSVGIKKELYVLAFNITYKYQTKKENETYQKFLFKITPNGHVTTYDAQRKKYSFRKRNFGVNKKELVKESRNAFESFNKGVQKDKYSIDSYGRLVYSDFKGVSNEEFKCSNLITSVELPKDLLSIEEESFFGCLNLFKISIPKSISVIKERTFTGCTSLKEVFFPKKLKSILDDAFFHCPNIKKLRIPKFVDFIGESAFDDCIGLESIKLPKNLKVIKAHTFNNCISLKRITIPEGVTRIEKEAFRDCYRLKEIILPKSLKDIDHDVFKGCMSLKKIKFNGTFSDWRRMDIDMKDRERLLKIPLKCRLF